MVETTVQLLATALALGSAYALTTLGFVLIINAVGAVNFAHGDLVMAGGFVAIALSLLLPEGLPAPGLILLPAVLWHDGMPSFDLAPPTWAALVYAALFGTAGAYLLYYRVLALAGAGNLLIVTLIIPPIAIALGALILHEALPARSFAGFALLALGLLAVNGRLPRLTLGRKRPRAG